MLQNIRAVMAGLADPLLDPHRRERTMIVLLVGYAVVWTVYGVLAKAGQDVQIDAAEVVIWSRHLAFGYAKHPPLAAWLTHAWFALFPVTDWAYYLFGLTYVTFGLWLAWRLYGFYLEPGKRVVALALLAFLPIYNFFSLRFDVNIVLAPLWIATTLAFLRSFETRSPLWAALAGIAAAAAMLGKYWSLFLLIGLGLAALMDRRRAAYFRSAAPWITVSVGALLIAPNVAWLVQNHFEPLQYAFAERAAGSFGGTLDATGKYIGGWIGYMAVPVAIALAAARPSGAALADTFAPKNDTRRFFIVALIVPLLLPALVALVREVELNAIWTLSGLTLLPLVLLSSDKVVVSRRAVETVLAAGIAYPIIMTIVAPGIALAIHRHNDNEVGMYGQMLAERMLAEWHKDTPAPLHLVGGDLDLSYVTAFYLPDKPLSLPVTEAQLAPWIDDARIKREGIALVCHVLLDLRYGQVCVHGYVGLDMQRILKFMPRARRVELMLTRKLFGVAGRPARFILYIVPPA